MLFQLGYLIDHEYNSNFIKMLFYCRSENFQKSDRPYPRARR